MSWLPSFSFGWLNGWVPFLLYALGFFLSIAPFTPECRAWLFNNPQESPRGIWKIIRIIGQLNTVAFIVMMVFTALRPDSPAFPAGVVLYGFGLLFVMSALYAFRITPAGKPVATGPYRLSRNPQWVGLFLVLLGSAFAAGIWLYVGMVLLTGVIYHKQIVDEETACLREFGESYREYMRRIPRYLWPC